jgi:hypothetical protein
MALKLDFSANALRLLKLLLNLSFQVKGKIDFQTFSPRENEPEFWEKLTREKLTFQLFKNKQRPRAWQAPHSKSEFQTFLTAREQPGSVRTCLNRKATFQVFKNNQRPSTWLKNHNPNSNLNAKHRSNSIDVKLITCLENSHSKSPIIKLLQKNYHK